MIMLVEKTLSKNFLNYIIDTIYYIYSIKFKKWLNQYTSNLSLKIIVMNLILIFICNIYIC